MPVKKLLTWSIPWQRTFEESTDFARHPCITHTLQLVIKKCYYNYYDTIISKARNLVGRFRKSYCLLS